MVDCIFCKIINKEIPADIVHETSNFIVFLDLNPVNQGHCLVVPKHHCLDIFDIPDELAEDMMLMVKRTSAAIQAAVHADGINVGMNNKAAAGQVVLHVHVHVIPRFKGDGLEDWARKKLSSDVMKETSDSIKKRF